MRSVTWASAAIVHAPVVGLNAAPSARSPATGKNETWSTAAETIAAPTRLRRGSFARRRRGATAVMTAGGSAMALSAVTDGILLLRLFFRSFLFAAPPKLCHDRRVGEGGRVAQRPGLGHVVG